MNQGNSERIVKEAGYRVSGYFGLGKLGFEDRYVKGRVVENSERIATEAGYRARSGFYPKGRPICHF